MNLKKIVASSTGLAVAFALATALSLGSFTVLPVPEASAGLNNFDCNAPQSGYLFLHDLDPNFGSLCYNGNGVDYGLHIYNKDYAQNDNYGNANLCYSYGACFYVGAYSSRYDLPTYQEMTSVSLGQ